MICSVVPQNPRSGVREEERHEAGTDRGAPPGLAPRSTVAGATERLLERLTPRPAAAPPGRLRPRTAWAGWARGARPLRQPRPRPDTTAAPAWRPREPGRRAWATSPGGAWQRQPPRLMGGAGARGVGGASRYREASPRRNGRHLEGPSRQPPAPQGVPAGGTAPGVPQTEMGAGRGLMKPPSIWRGQACATGRRGLASPGARQ